MSHDGPHEPHPKFSNDLNGLEGTALSRTGLPNEWRPLSINCVLSVKTDTDEHPHGKAYRLIAVKGVTLTLKPITGYAIGRPGDLAVVWHPDKPQAQVAFRVFELFKGLLLLKASKQ